MMTPQNQLPGLPPEHYSNLPWYLAMAGMAVSKIEAVSMKTLLTIAVTVIMALLGWGFLATQGYLKEVREDIKDLRVELKVEHNAKNLKDNEQDKCLAEVRESQRNLEKLIVPYFIGPKQNGVKP